MGRRSESSRSRRRDESSEGRSSDRSYRGHGSREASEHHTLRAHSRGRRRPPARSERAALRQAAQSVGALRDSWGPGAESDCSTVYATSIRAASDDEDSLSDIYAAIRGGHRDSYSVQARIASTAPERTVSSSSSSDSSRPLLRSARGRQTVFCAPLAPVLVGGAPPPPSTSYLTSIYEEIHHKSRPSVGITALLLTVSSLLALLTGILLMHLELPVAEPGLDSVLVQKVASRLANTFTREVTGKGLVRSSYVASYGLGQVSTQAAPDGSDKVPKQSPRDRCDYVVSKRWGRLPNDSRNSTKLVVQQPGYYHIQSKVLIKAGEGRERCTVSLLPYDSSGLNWYRNDASSVLDMTWNDSDLDQEACQALVYKLEQSTTLFVIVECTPSTECKAVVDVKRSSVSMTYLGPALS